MSFPLIPDIIYTVGLQVERMNLPVFFRLSTHFNTISKRDFFWYQRILMDFPQHSQIDVDKIVMTRWQGYRHVYDALLIVRRDPMMSIVWRANIKIATRNDDISTMKMLLDPEGPIYIRTIFRTAAKYGSLNILEWIYDYSRLWMTTTTSVATRYGQLEVIKWASVKSNFRPKDATDIINKKTRHNHTHIIEWLLEKYPSEREGILRAVFTKAFDDDNEEIMNWCRQKGFSDLS